GATNNPWLVFLGPIVVAGVTGLVTWKVAIRSTSGTVGTSQSDQLWNAWRDLQAAGDQLREDMAAELIRWRDENRALHEQVEALTQQVRELLPLRAENEGLRRRIETLTERVRVLEGQHG